MFSIEEVEIINIMRIRIYKYFVFCNLLVVFFSVSLDKGNISRKSGNFFKIYVVYLVILWEGDMDLSILCVLSIVFGVDDMLMK